MFIRRGFTGATDCAELVTLLLILSMLIVVGAAVLFILIMLSFILGGTFLIPAPSRVLHRMMELAGIKPGEKGCDLACGDGRLVIEANKMATRRGSGY